MIPRHRPSSPRGVSLSSTGGLLGKVRTPSFDAGSCLDRDDSSPGWTLEDCKTRKHDSTLDDRLIDSRLVAFVERQRPARPAVRHVDRMEPSAWRTGIGRIFRDDSEIHARRIAVLW